MSQENNFVPEQKSYKPLSPFKLFVKSNFPFIEATFEALDNYGLYCKIVEYLNTIISNEKEVEENVRLLYNAFVELNNYVSNYFDNLDVQEEINNKLDDMVEQGTLQEIISVYLNSKAVFGFDNVEAMQEAENLMDGSFAKTLGYYSKNDCGSGFYKIRTRTVEDIIDNGSLIVLDDNTLIAELIVINGIVTPEQFGAKGNGTDDDSTSLQTVINYCATNKYKLLLNNKYLTSVNINIPRGITIEGNTLNGSIIGDNSNSLILKGGNATSSYANGSDASNFYNIYFEKISVVLGDTTDDWGAGVTFNKCIFFGNNATTNGLIVKNHSWVFSIIDCKIANYTNGIFFAFKNADDSYVLDSGAAIKIDNTDIFNCSKGVYIKGSADDGYDIQITNCDFEHNDYSIYIEDGRGNNVQCNNLHIEGNRIGSIYVDKSNVYVNNIWDFDSNPNTYIAKFTAINGGRIFIFSGRMAIHDNKFVKNIDSTVYLNYKQIVMEPYLFNKPVLTDDSTRGIILPDGTNYPLPNSVNTAVLSAGQSVTLSSIEKGSNNGCRIELLLRQKDSQASENDPTISVFMNSTSGNVGYSIPLPKYNAYVSLDIEYREHTLKIVSSYIVDGASTSTSFIREQYFDTDTIEYAKSITIRYNNGVGSLSVNKANAVALNGYFSVL